MAQLSYDTLALLLASLIFLITVILLIARLIGFWIALLLLLFSLATGMLVGNFGGLKEYLHSHNKQEIEQIQKEQQLLKERVDLLTSDLDQLKHEIKQ